MGKYFGMDGFRGEANADLTVEHAYEVGHFLGWYYGQKIPDEGYRVIIGEDTRRGSYMFEYSLAAGLTVSGANVYLLRVTTTPNIPYVMRTEGFNCGIMISASHNPFYDSGIRVINEKDEKLEESVVPEVKKYLDGEMDKIPLVRKKNIGRTAGFAAGRNRHIGYPIPITIRSSKNMRVALDCANGSASAITKNVFGALDAEAHVMNNGPSGLNINTDCGSTHIQYLQGFVTGNRCDLGPAYDGDAGRCIAVDVVGNVVDGDVVMYICGKYMKEQETSFDNTVVTVIMSNFGLYKAFEREGISYVKTAVGDKYVYENMVVTGNCLGGEQSGHVIFNEHATTGDGILTSLRVMEVALEKKQPLDKLASEVEIYPQILESVRVEDKKEARDDGAVQAEIAKVAESLSIGGRILLRQSGTGPTVHVMVRAPALDLCEEYVDQVIDVVKSQGHCVQGCGLSTSYGSLLFQHGLRQPS